MLDAAACGRLILYPFAIAAPEELLKYCSATHRMD
jgi:hypothetical protein